jgi:hypothetical protein
MTNIASRIEVSPVTAAPELRRDRGVVLPLSAAPGEVSLVLLPDLLL